MSKAEESGCREQICYLWPRRGNTAEKLVAADPGKYHAISLRPDVCVELSGAASRPDFRSRTRRKSLIARPEIIGRGSIDVAASAPALFFYLGKPVALVPVWFRIVVIGDRVEARRFR